MLSKLTELVKICLWWICVIPIRKLSKWIVSGLTQRLKILNKNLIIWPMAKNEN